MPCAKRNWKPEEDALLRRAVELAQSQSRPLLWRELAKSVPGRSNKDCRRRWWNSLVDGTTKGPWSKEEDERLIMAVRKYGTSWRQVSRDVGSRNADQCSSHWCQVLDPNINYRDWTPEEDANLLHAILTHGTNWANIAASHTPNRTTLALKNRYSTLRLKNANVNKDKANSEMANKPVAEKNDIDWTSETQGWDEVEVAFPSDDEDDGDDGAEDEEDEYEHDLEENTQDVNMQNTVQEKDNTAEAKDTVNSGTIYHSEAMTIQIPDPSFTTWNEQSQNNTQTSDSTSRATPSTVYASNHTPYDTPLGFNNRSSSQYPTLDGRYYIRQDSDSMILGEPYKTYDTNTLEMHPDMPTLPSFRTVFQPALALSTADLVPAVSADAPVPTRMGFETPLSMSSPSGSPQSTIYKVSITMDCTRGQLDAAMAQMASIGSSMIIKIDTNS